MLLTTEMMRGQQDLGKVVFTLLFHILEIFAWLEIHFNLALVIYQCVTIYYELRDVKTKPSRFAVVGEAWNGHVTPQVHPYAYAQVN